jgi:hypothetical protein
LLDQRSGAHGGAPVGQLGQQVVTRERRSFGRELLIGAILPAGNGHSLFQLTLDRISARKQLPDVVSRDLHFELGVRNRLRPREPVLERQHAEEQQVPDEPDRTGYPSRSRLRTLSLWQPLGAPRPSERLTAAVRR